MRVKRTRCLDVVGSNYIPYKSQISVKFTLGLLYLILYTEILRVQKRLTGTEHELPKICLTELQVNMF